MEDEVRKELKRVERTLDQIRENTSPPWWHAILNGTLYGSGAVLGTIFTIAILGWLLSLFGILPGIGELAQRLQQILNSKF